MKPNWLSENLNSINSLITKVFVYGIAGVVILKLLNMLESMVAIDPQQFGVAAIGIIGSAVSIVLAFLFGVEQGRQQQKAFESGLYINPPGSGTNVEHADTVEGGNPTVVNPPNPPKPPDA